MKTYKTSASIEKILDYYKGEIIDCIEGCLIDNFLISTEKDGLIMVKETYQNCWTSIYTIYTSIDRWEVCIEWEALQAKSEVKA